MGSHFRGGVGSDFGKGEGPSEKAGHTFKAVWAVSNGLHSNRSDHDLGAPHPDKPSIVLFDSITLWVPRWPSGGDGRKLWRPEDLT